MLFLKSNSLKFTIVFFCLLICGLPVFFLNFDQENEVPQFKDLKTPSDALLALEKIHQVSTREGLKEWILDAQSAHYLADKQQTVLTQISLVFFLKDGSQVRLKANQGILYVDTKNFEIKGNVVIDNFQYQLKTEKLQYSNKKKLLFSDDPINIHGKQFDFMANSMVFELDTNHAIFNGNVEGYYENNFIM